MSKLQHILLTTLLVLILITVLLFSYFLFTPKKQMPANSGQVSELIHISSGKSYIKLKNRLDELYKEKGFISECDLKELNKIQSKISREEQYNIPFKIWLLIACIVPIILMSILIKFNISFWFMGFAGIPFYFTTKQSIRLDNASRLIDSAIETFGSNEEEYEARI